MGLLDLLFPKRCVGCNREGEWVCSSCWEDTAKEAKFEEVEEGVVALYPFEYPIIRELLHNLKYNAIHDLAAQVVVMTREWLNRGLLMDSLGGKELVLVPVPISKSRRKERGYNQAELLADELGSWLEAPVCNSVLMRRKGKSLVGKRAEERKLEVQDSFLVQNADHLVPFGDHQIVVVDDVMTTGSTLQSCREKLQPYTQLPVKGLVIARKH